MQKGLLAHSLGVSTRGKVRKRPQVELREQQIIWIKEKGLFGTLGKE